MAKRNRDYTGAAEQAEASRVEQMTQVEESGLLDTNGHSPAEVNGAAHESKKRLYPVRYWICRIPDGGKPPVVVSIAKSWRSSQAKVSELRLLLGGTDVNLEVYKAKVASKPKRQATKLKADNPVVS